MARIDINSDTMFKALNQELNSRYGKGELYKNFDHLNYTETFTHVTEDRIKRTVEIDRLALDMGKDPIRLIEEDHRHQIKPLSFPDHPINPIISTASESYYNAMKVLHGNKQGFEPRYGWEEETVKPKKKSKLKGNIRERLQKETDSWLKSVQKEED